MLSFQICHTEIAVKWLYSSYNFYLTIVLRVRVGYDHELAIIISYPTRATGIIISLKTPAHKISRILFDFIWKKTTDIMLVFNFEQLAYS